MLKKSTLVILTIIILMFSGFAIALLVTVLTFGDYQESFTYKYNPQEASSLGELRLYSDITDVDIRYNSTPMIHYVEIKANFHMRGPLISGRNYLHYFKPIMWENRSSPNNFTLESLPTVQIEQPLMNNSIIVTLRSDIIYTLTVITLSGNVRTSISQELIIDKINITSATGVITLIAKDTTFNGGIEALTYSSDVILNFTNCKMNSYIEVYSTGGNFTIISSNMTYLRDSYWYLETIVGNINIEIFQDIELGAKVTGAARNSRGAINILYRDSLNTVGARFTANAPNEGISLTNSTGFKISLAIGTIIVFDSLDYVTTSNNYNFLLESDSGVITIYGMSVPLDWD
jgi:hypothetical protein